MRRTDLTEKIDWVIKKSEEIFIEGGKIRVSGQPAYALGSGQDNELD